MAERTTRAATESGKNTSPGPGEASWHDPVLQPDATQPGDIYNRQTNLNNQTTVAELQEYLRIISFFNPAIPTVNVDGTLDEKTRAAILRFQDVYNVPRDEENSDMMTFYAARDAARRYLDSVSPGLSVIPLPRGNAMPLLWSDSDLVAIMQVMLNTIRKQYPDLHPLAVDGKESPQMRQNVNYLLSLYGVSESEIETLIAWNVIADAYNTVRKRALKPPRPNAPQKGLPGA